MDEKENKIRKKEKLMSWYSGLWRPEDRGRKILRNVGILPHHYMMSQPIRQRLECLVTVRTSNIAEIRRNDQGN